MSADGMFWQESLRQVLEEKLEAVEKVMELEVEMLSVSRNCKFVHAGRDFKPKPKAAVLGKTILN